MWVWVCVPRCSKSDVVWYSRMNSSSGREIQCVKGAFLTKQPNTRTSRSIYSVLTSLSSLLTSQSACGILNYQPITRLILILAGLPCHLRVVGFRLHIFTPSIRGTSTVLGATASADCGCDASISLAPKRKSSTMERHHVKGTGIAIVSVPVPQHPPPLWLSGFQRNEFLHCIGPPRNRVQFFVMLANWRNEDNRFVLLKLMKNTSVIVLALQRCWPLSLALSI